jgi:hypothetical protein
MTFDEAIHLLEVAMGQDHGDPITWGELQSAWFVVQDYYTRSKKVFLDVMSFEGDLNLSKEGEFPHSLSPEAMLKQIIGQTMGRHQ